MNCNNEVNTPPDLAPHHIRPDSAASYLEFTQTQPLNPRPTTILRAQDSQLTSVISSDKQHLGEVSSMLFGFSVGDFLGVLKLAIDIFNTLSEESGVSVELQRLRVTLNSHQIKKGHRQFRESG